jgi:16S rRNA processing protein RimM
LDKNSSNKPALDGYTCIGKLSKTHGYDGGVTVTLDVDNPEDFEILESVFVEFNGKLVPFFVNKISYAGKTNLRLSFLDYNSDKKIDEFIGCSLYLPDDSLPESDEEIEEGLSELIGYSAIDIETNKIIGFITRIIENPAHPLFEIQAKEKSVLVPAVEDFIAAIDADKKHISFKLPEGLLDL